MNDRRSAAYKGAPFAIPSICLVSVIAGEKKIADSFDDNSVKNTAINSIGIYNVEQYTSDHTADSLVLKEEGTLKAESTYIGLSGAGTIQIGNYEFIGGNTGILGASKKDP